MKTWGKNTAGMRSDSAGNNAAEDRRRALYSQGAGQIDCRMRPRRRLATLIYALILIDKPQRSALRQSLRPQHKAYLAAVADRIAFAGPFATDDGETMLGSLLAIDFESRDAAHEWLAEEPFTKAGLYASTSVHAFVNLWPQKAGSPPQP